MSDTESDDRAPGWFVTFSDMMSLLLTFFVMLVSFSELKSEEKYQALMDGFQQQFGEANEPGALAPGELRRRDARLSRMVVASREERQAVLGSYSQRTANKGVTNLSSGPNGGARRRATAVLYFQEDQIELDDHQRSLLAALAAQHRDRPQQVEVRGFAAGPEASMGTRGRNRWDVSLERCRRVMQYLVEEQQFPERRLRISATSAADLPATGGEPALPGHSRVELWLADDEETGANAP